MDQQQLLAIFNGTDAPAGDGGGMSAGDDAGMDGGEQAGDDDDNFNEEEPQ